MSNKHENIGTLCYVVKDEAPTCRQEEALAFFRRVEAELPNLPLVGDAPGYRIFYRHLPSERLARDAKGARRLDESRVFRREILDDFQYLDVRDAADDALVVGRHSEADLQLEGDPGVALRHLLLRPQQRGGAPRIELIDLLAEMPIFIDGLDVPVRSACLEGPFSIRLGQHVLCGFPIVGCIPREKEKTRHESDEEEADESPEQRGPTGLNCIIEEKIESKAAQLSLSFDSHVEVQQEEKQLDLILGSGSILRSLSQSVEATDICDDRGPRLHVHSGNRKRSYAIEENRWTIIGRYRRCNAGKSLLSTGASRVHVAIRYRQDGLEVIDLASTNGTKVDDVRIRRAIVPLGTKIKVGDEDWVEVSAR